MTLFLLLVLGGTIRGMVYVVSKYISVENSTPLSMATANAIADTVLSLPIGIILFIYHPINFSLELLILAVISGAIYSMALISQYASLKRINMSEMSLLLQINIVFSAILGITILKESLNLWNFMGLGLIIIGNLTILIKKGKFKFNAGVLFALGAGIFSAIASTIDKDILNYIAAGFYVTVNSALILLSLVVINPKMITKSARLIRSKLKIFLLFSLFNLGSWYIGSFVLQNMEVSKFTPIQKSITLIIPVISGIIIFNEKQNLKLKILGLILAVSGIGLMYL